MAIYSVPAAGAAGLVQDLSSHELPPNAWTDALNIRFLDGMAYQFAGHGEVYDGAPVVPLHLMQVNVGADRYWMYASAAKLYAVSSASGAVVHTNITRQTAAVDVDYSGAANAWTSTSLSGIPVFNPGNTTDPPQAWNLNPASRAAALPAWPANTYCRSLRAYKNQLVALNVTKGGVNYPFMVKWSHPADPGTVPVSWDETDPTLDAGEVDLAEGGDPIQDGLQLGGTFVVYKEQSVWRMDYAGGAFIQQFTKVLGTSGAMNRNCVVEIDGFHVVLTGSDVVVHDGQSARSILDKRMRRSLFRMIDATNFGRSFLFKNPFLNEVFICFPSAGATVPDMALVWNYVDRTTTFRAIPNLNHANYGPVESGLGQPWSGDSSPWASDNTTWAGAEFTPSSARVLLGSNDQKLFLLDSSFYFDQAQPTAFLERRGLSLGAPNRLKLVQGIRPRIAGLPGETLSIRLGGSAEPYAEPDYGAPQTFTVGETLKVDSLVTARYVAVRLENTGGATDWRLDSYDIEYEDAGEF